MSKALGMRCVWGLCGVLGSVLALASVARAEVSTDVSGSVLVFPKVIYDGSILPDSGNDGRDTVIQISNTSNNLVHAHCFYVNGAPDAFGNPLWQVTDFTIWLTRQQPTHWVASEGRQVNPSDNFPGGQDGSGLDPGAVPPVPPGFQGELKCVQIDASGTPFGGNNLKGEAVIQSADGDVSKYNAIAILANPDLAGDFPPNELLLNNTPANDGEYNACPDVLLLDHFVDGTPNPVITDLNPAACVGGDCPIRTYLTVIPCTQDFENAQSTFVTMQFAIINELEQVFSASTSVLCWRSTRLADIDAPTGRCTESGEACVTDAQCIEADEGFCNKNSVFSVGVLGTGSAYTRISPVDPFGGVLAVAEEYQYNNIDDGGDQLTRVARGAWNLQQQGNRYNPDAHVTDKITIPVFSGF
ncbi:MAG: hypothetical protein U0802_11325 [Candidatus Binatia bacterium]